MFKSRLNQLMKMKKISGKEISFATGISESTISKFLSGTQEPKYSQILNIAAALNLPPEVFMSLISNQYDTTQPILNECCLIREIFKDASSSLHIITVHSFKEFTIDFADELDDKTIIVTIILRGGTDSKFGSLHTGEYRIRKGSDYRGTKVTIHKDSIIIAYIIQKSPEAIIKDWSKLFLID